MLTQQLYTVSVIEAFIEKFCPCRQSTVGKSENDRGRAGNHHLEGEAGNKHLNRCHVVLSERTFHFFGRTCGSYY